MAEWLDSFFSGFDYTWLRLMHELCESCGVWLTPIMRFITLVGEKGILMFALALVLMLFKKTRERGVCVFGAVSCGALITNIILKDNVCRIRPFLGSVAEYGQWWLAGGFPNETGFSFPSGHVTAAAAGICAFFMCSKKKKLSWLSFLYVVLMAVSRTYLMAHYPSDVLFATVIGVLSAVAAFFIARWIFAFLEKHRDVKLFAFVLDFDMREIGKPEKPNA